MYDLIHGNLTRQFKGLELLLSLLEEEFDLLCARDYVCFALFYRRKFTKSKGQCSETELCGRLFDPSHNRLPRPLRRNKAQKLIVFAEIA